MPIYVEAKDLSPEDIYEEWLDMEAIHARATVMLKEEKAAAEVAMKSTDPAVKAKFAIRMDILSENMCVLDAWCAVLHAAWVFQTHGAHCIFFEGTGHETGFEPCRPEQDREL